MLFLFSCTPNQTLDPSVGSDETIVDVLIIGGGASGMATAKRLLELGIEPLILERESQLGGAGIHAGRFFAVATPWQQEAGIQDSLSLALEEWPDFSGGYSSPPQIQSFLAQSADTLLWLQENGAVFDGVHKDIGAGSIPRIHKLSSEVPPPLIQWTPELLLYSQVNTEVTSLEQQNDYFIVAAEDEQWKAKHVVITSGGFARNIHLVEENLPQITEFNWHTEAWPGMTGMSVDLLSDLDISLPNLSNLGLYAHSVTDVILGQPEVMIIPALQRSVIVTKEGTREFNEQLTQSLQSGQIFLEKGPLFAIFDTPLWQGTTFQGMGYNYENVTSVTSEYFQENSNLINFETLDQLANHFSFPIEQFVNTISMYNQGIENGQDLFGKDVHILSPIQTPPFYALPITITTAKSFGGANTNQHGTILNEGNIISRLYAAGEASGFLGGDFVGWGFSGSITACYHQGKMIAEDIYLSMN